MRDKRDKRDPVEFVLEENPNLEWDDIHDVRELAELLGAMVTDLEKKVYEPDCWLEVSEHADELEDHYFYLVTHADFGTPMKAKYHNDMGGYFEIKSSDKKIPVEYVNPIIGESKIKYFMLLPEMPEDYKGHGPLYKFLEREEYQKIIESGDKRALAHYKLKHNYCMSPEEQALVDEDRVNKEYNEALNGIKSYASASPNLLDRDPCAGLTCFIEKEGDVCRYCEDLSHTFDVAENYHYFDCKKKGTGVAIPEKDIINNTIVIEPGAFNGEEF